MENGRHHTFFFVFDKNKVKIDNLSLKYKGYLDGKRKNEWNNDKGLMEFNVFDLWYVNVNPTDTAGILNSLINIIMN